jgi:Putative prokaryotic signal transducing protein
VSVFDGNMSAVQGTLSAVPQRLAVAEDDWAQARRLLDEAGLGQWIVQ